MEMQTDAGVLVKVVHEKRGRLLIFSRPVQLLELSSQEATSMGNSLVRDGQVGITPAIRDLKKHGFFRKPRRFGDIKKELSGKGLRVKSASLNVVLSKLVERQELTRQGEPGEYLYRD